MFHHMPNDSLSNAALLDATWPAVTLTALRDVSKETLGWDTRLLAARPWLPDAPWAVLVPFAFGGRSILAGVFLEDDAADQLARQVSVLRRPADEHEVGNSIGEFAEDLSSCLVQRRQHIAADLSAGTPMVCRGRVDVGIAANASALEVQVGPLRTWLTIIRPRPAHREIPGPLFG